MSREIQLRRSKVTRYKKQIASHLSSLEKVNGAALALLNKMLCDSDFNNIQDDVYYVLNNNFCNGEHLLTGFMEVMDEMRGQLADAV